jgi:hypothetical protein
MLGTLQTLEWFSGNNGYTGNYRLQGPPKMGLLYVQSANLRSMEALWCYNSLALKLIYYCLFFAFSCSFLLKFFGLGDLVRSTSELTSETTKVLDQGCPNLGRQVNRATKFFYSGTNICGSSICNLPTSPFWWLDFWVAARFLENLWNPCFRNVADHLEWGIDKPQGTYTDNSKHNVTPTHIPLPTTLQTHTLTARVAGRSIRALLA